MENTILNTKFYIPNTRAKLIHRDRLINKLNQGIHRKLSLISAPAGFGKTTLVTEWLSDLQFNAENQTQIHNCVAWLSMDEGDNDPVQFLNYFIEALKRADGIADTIGQKAINMLQSPQPPSFETILTSVINEITSIPDRIILILDDFHLVENQSIHDAVTFFFKHQPKNFHLVIVTREDPHLSLSRLRTRTQLTELRAIDLKFSSEETTEFLNQIMNLNISEEDISILDSRTEGWIAGLQLAAISMQGHTDISNFVQSFTGSHRFVLDYLIEEVLKHQPKQVRDFLLLTSILDRLTGSLCDALTNENNGQQTLENLEQANLFIIPLDDERQWYRYHHLFADLLRQRSRQIIPDQLPELHRRASLWYDHLGYRVEAIDHALHSADYLRAIELINLDVEGNYEDVALLTLQRWLTAIPENLIMAHPPILLLKAWYLFNIGQIETADQSLMDVTQLIETSDQLSDPMRAALSGRALAIRAFIASLRGDFAGSEQFSRQSLDLLPAAEQAWRSSVTITLGEAYAAQGQIADAQHFRAEALRLSQSAGNPFIIMIANLNLTETLWQRGQIMAVLEICEHQMQFATDHNLNETPIIGWLLGIWGAALAEMNQLDKALELSQKSVELAEHGQDMFYIGNSYLYRVRVLFAAGDRYAVDNILQEIAHTDALAPLVTAQVSAWQIRIWLAEGKLDIAAQWLNENNLNVDGELPYVHEADYVAVARVLLALGRLDSASDLLTRLQEVAEVGGRNLRVIELLILRALAAQANEDLPQALALIEQALILGESRGLIQVFVDEGSDLARLLYTAIKQDILPTYAQRIIAAFPIETPLPTTVQALSEDEWIEPLTDRELEILQLVAEGLSNQEAGNRLYLSANTVKAHLRNIYGKFGVNNRTQAVAKGRSLGIIWDS